MLNSTMKKIDSRCMAKVQNLKFWSLTGTILVWYCVGVLMYGVNGELEMKEKKKRDKQLYIDINLYGCKLEKIKTLS